MHAVLHGAQLMQEYAAETGRPDDLSAAALSRKRAVSYSTEDSIPSRGRANAVWALVSPRCRFTCTCFSLEGECRGGMSGSPTHVDDFSPSFAQNEVAGSDGAGDQASKAGASGQGTANLEGIKPAGFMDDKNYPGEGCYYLLLFSERRRQPNILRLLLFLLQFRPAVSELTMKSLRSLTSGSRD